MHCLLRLTLYAFGSRIYAMLHALCAMPAVGYTDTENRHGHDFNWNVPQNN